MKKLQLLLLLLCCAVLAAACADGRSGSVASAPEPDPPEGHGDAAEGATLLIAAAASLQYSFEDVLFPLFREQYPHIQVKGTFDSSGKLQTQIESGLGADVFLSAAMAQMEALVEGGLVEEGSVVELLENKIVLIKSAGGETAVTGFADAALAGAIALGDPDSVPAGQYAREAFTSLGNWTEVSAKASFGTNVTEVLSWISAASAEVGVVYATDAATTGQVEVIAEAPEGSLAQKVIYPAGLVADSAQPEAARLFLEFLESPQALAVFAEYGFTPMG